MTPRPQGYREPTDEEMKCLPEGSLYDLGGQWEPSELVGKEGVNTSKLAYAVPAFDLGPEPSQESALAVQVGGDHYKTLAIQPVEYCQRNKLGHIESNVVKYVTRHRTKNGRQDIEKAIHNLQILLEMEYPA